jgi:hypothetical protein
MSDKQKYIIMNVDVPGRPQHPKSGPEFPKGTMWPYDEAPYVRSDGTTGGPRWWADNKDIAGEKRICLIVDQDGNLLEKVDEIKRKKVDPHEGLNDVTRKLYGNSCKGVKDTGEPCGMKALLSNGYCRHHQNQSDNPLTPNSHLKPRLAEIA